MRTVLFVFLFLIFTSDFTFSQVSINQDGSLPDTSAMLEIKSNQKGMLIPRMKEEERDAIIRPARGLSIYNLSDNNFYYNQGTSLNKNWVRLNSHWSSIYSDIFYNSGKVGIGTSHPITNLTLRADFSMNNYRPQFIIEGKTDTTYKIGIGYNTVSDYAYIQAWRENVDIRNLSLNPLGGNIGINTNSPQTKLDIQGGVLNIGNAGADVGAVGEMLRFTKPGSPTTYFNSIYSRNSASASNGLLTFSLNVSGPTTQIDVLTLRNSGNVGIGTTSPSATLDVNGTIKASDKITTATPGVNAGLNLPPGSLPSSLADGDLWTTSGGLYTRINGTTFGPLSSTTGTISSITAMAPLTGGTITATGTIGLPSGNMTSSDIAIINGAGSVIGTGTDLIINKGNLTESTSSVLTFSGNSNSVLGSGTSIQVKKSSGTQDGYLSSTDWTTFNSKQNALTTGNLSSSDITVSNGTGAIIGTGTGLTINKGTLSSSDITITGGTNAVLGSGASLAINKGSLTEATSNVLTFTGNTNSILGTGTTIQVKAASGTQNGYLSSGDYSRIHGTTGSVLFFDGSGVSQNNSNLFWDNSTHRLGIKIIPTTSTFEVNGTGKFYDKLTTTASSTSNSGFILPPGTAPASPADGDLWTTTSGLYARINGSTIGPLSSTTGTITSITATSPLTGGTITSTGTVGLPSGNLTSSDISVTGGTGSVIGTGTDLTINKGNLTESTSSVLTLSGNTNSVLGSGTSIQVKKSSGTQDGYLSSTDWTTFNSKQNALTTGNLSSSDITVSNGNGAVIGSGTGLTVNKGTLSSSDITITGGTNAVLGSGASLTINKGNLTESTSNVLTLTGNTNSVLGTGTSIQVKAASGTQNGYLSSGDYSRIHGTSGSVLFFDGNGVSQNNTNLFWDNSAHRLGIKIAPSTSTLEVNGTGKFYDKLTTAAASVTTSGFMLQPGVAPSTPSDGDLWTTTSGLFAQINGATIGPLSSTTGTITSITATSPLTGGTITSTGTIGLPSGNLTSSDMAVTNGTGSVIGPGTTLTINKGSLSSSDLTITGGTNAVLGSGASLTINKGNLTESTSNVLTFTGNTNDVLGSGTSIQVKKSSGIQDGYLSSIDWTTFNSKQNAFNTGTVSAGSSKITIGGSPVNSVIGTTGFTVDVNPSYVDHNSLLNYDPKKHFYQKVIDTVNTALSGLVKATSGKLSAITDNSANWDAGYTYRVTSASGTSPLILNLSSNAITGSIPNASSSDGYLSHSDWTNFNGKENVLTFNSPLQRNINIISIPNANSSDGYLSHTDWTTFNNKVNTVTATSPVFSSGGVSPNITIQVASSSQNGYLSSSDWTMFNNKWTISGSNLYYNSGNVGVGNNSPSGLFSVGSTSQFQVASTGQTTVTLSAANSGAIIAKNTNASNGTGVIGVGNNVSSFSPPSTGCGGAFVGTTSGVYGEGGTNGVYGYGTTYGVYGQPATVAGGKWGGYFNSGNNSAWAWVGGYIGSTPYKIYGNGGTNLMVLSPTGENIDMFYQASPEFLLTDNGTGNLINGFAHIALDPNYSCNIVSNDKYPMKVFIQVEGDCKGVYVTNKSVNGFDVKELQGGSSDVSFSWSILANQKDDIDANGNLRGKYLGIRFPKSTKPEEFSQKLVK